MSIGVPFVILWAISLSAMLWGALTDLRLRIIPDTVSLLVAASGLTIAYLLRPDDIYPSLAAFLIVFAGMCVLAYYDFVGGGDVKLISSVCLLVPPNDVGGLLLEIALAGGLLSCVYLVARSWLRRQLVPSPGGPAAIRPLRFASSDLLRAEAGRIVVGEPMPYAFAILGGVILHGARGLYQCHFAACSFS